ncbi:Asp/Glu/hydantoin racemase [Thalassobaculum fulvum]|uniref:Asp/Glu/hydantoin racemase n=1 Tax=Thalassobaculum fulvum TaxID=1633335 RepID=A0A918XP38_9PROT|nr:aspartate/glutamate racemase family protein [Thalassobaculum fulvum]GHD43553.1 Asp/Glu/hydantoin racemase [Thalassobaculum fulvum]
MTRRILVLNPNVTEAITATMVEEARRVASADTEIVPATARFGTQYIENRVEAAIAGHAVLDALAEQAPGCDAAVVAAFGDPGVFAAKEMLEIPVIGISEAAFLTAYTLGRRYAVVCLTPRLGVWYRECAEEHGLDGRLVAVRPLDVPPSDITAAKQQTGRRLVEACHEVIDRHGAEVVIMGGGPIAGLARTVAHEIPVPVLDGVSCAVRLAEALVDLAPRPATRGSFARPPAKPSQGLAPALQAWVERSGERR